jgi:VWFA-related protein
LRRRSVCVILPLFTYLATLPIVAQNTQPGDAGPAPSFRTSAQDVVVDLVVAGSKGHAAPRLHQGGLQVFEDGKPQAIDLFEEHVVAAGVSAAAAQPLPPHVFTNQPMTPQGSAVNVLLLDRLNTQPEDQTRVHDQIAAFLKNLQPGTEVAIFSLGKKLQLEQGFTADASLLIAGLESASKERVASIVGATTRQDQATEEMQQALMAQSQAKDAAEPAQVQMNGNDRGALTLEAMQELARYLAAIPGRKDVIWFSSSLPVTLFPTTSEQQNPYRDANKSPSLFFDIVVVRVG